MADARYLSIYLNDHLAGATGGLALARRCRRSNPEPPLGPLLDELIRELRADKGLLEVVMATKGIPRSRLKQSGVVIGERVARLKLNGAVVTYSPLSRLLELEGLRLGIYAKRAMWESLLLLGGLGELDEEVRAAVGRADDQVRRVENARRGAAESALSAGDSRKGA